MTRLNSHSICFNLRYCNQKKGVGLARDLVEKGIGHWYHLNQLKSAKVSKQQTIVMVSCLENWVGLGVPGTPGQEHKALTIRRHLNLYWAVTFISPHDNPVRTISFSRFLRQVVVRPLCLLPCGVQSIDALIMLSGFGDSGYRSIELFDSKPWWSLLRLDDLQMSFKLERRSWLYSFCGWYLRVFFHLQRWWGLGSFLGISVRFVMSELSGALRSDSLCVAMLSLRCSFLMRLTFLHPPYVQKQSNYYLGPKTFRTWQ